jgi:hypothetical protein
MNWVTMWFAAGALVIVPGPQELSREKKPTEQVVRQRSPGNGVQFYEIGDPRDRRS